MAERSWARWIRSWSAETPPSSASDVGPRSAWRACRCHSAVRIELRIESDSFRARASVASASSGGCSMYARSAAQPSVSTAETNGLSSVSSAQYRGRFTSSSTSRRWQTISTGDHESGSGRRFHWFGSSIRVKPRSAARWPRNRAKMTGGSAGGSSSGSACTSCNQIAASAEGLGQQWRRGQDDVKTRVPSFLGEAGALWLLMGRLLREWDQPLGLDFFVHTLQVSPEGQCTILEAVGEDLLQGALWIQVFLHRLKRAVQTTRQVARRVGAGKPSEQRISIGRMHLLRIDLVNAPFDRDDRGCDQDCCPSGSTLRCNSWQCPHPISGSATSSSVLVH